MGARRVAGGLEESFRIGIAERFQEHDCSVGGVLGERLHHSGAEYGASPVRWVPEEEERARELRFATFSAPSAAFFVMSTIRRRRVVGVFLF